MTHGEKTTTSNASTISEQIPVRTPLDAASWCDWWQFLVLVIQIWHTLECIFGHDSKVSMANPRPAKLLWLSFATSFITAADGAKKKEFQLASWSLANGQTWCVASFEHFVSIHLGMSLSKIDELSFHAAILHSAGSPFKWQLLACIINHGQLKNLVGETTSCHHFLGRCQSTTTFFVCFWSKNNIC